MAAWVVNAIAREAPGDLQRVLDLGARLREAQEAGDRDRLRTLSGERRALLAEVAAAAADRAEEAGQHVGDAALEEVQQTLQAAMAAPDTASRVRSGRLVRALDADGSGEVDPVSGAAPQPADPSREHRGSARQEDERRRAAARRAEEAQHRAQDAAATARDADRAVEERTRDLEDLDRRIEELGARRDVADQALQRATAEARSARQDADSAADDAERARSDLHDA